MSFSQYWKKGQNCKKKVSLGYILQFKFICIALFTIQSLQSALQEIKFLQYIYIYIYLAILKFFCNCEFTSHNSDFIVCKCEFISHNSEKKNSELQKSQFISHNSDSIICNCEFIAHNAEKKVRTVRYKLTIIRKLSFSFRIGLYFSQLWVYISQFWEKVYYNYKL